MDSPCEIGALIMENVVSGNLAELNAIKTRVGDVRKLGGICDVYCDFSNGRRVLHSAAELGHFEICEFLIEDVGVHIDVLTYKGDTPLMLAVKEERLKVVGYLISKNALIVVSNSKGFTSLHYAVQKENLELINLLLEKGAHIEADSVEGTPLQCAASRGCVNAAKFLLNRMAKPNPDSLIFGSPLISAIKSQSFECMELLLEADADPNNFFCGLTPLAHAAKIGDTKYIMRLIAAGANPDLPCTDLMIPIEHAALVHNLEGVEVLFPLTDRITHYQNWTVDGIMDYCHSEEAQTMRNKFRMHCLLEADKLCLSAVSNEDHNTLLRCASETAYLDPSNPTCLSNRSMCLARMGKAVHALRDAKECIPLLISEADYEQIKAAANALNLFQRYHTAATNLTLEPQNKEFENTFRVALFEYFSWMYLLCGGTEMMLFFQKFV